MALYAAAPELIRRTAIARIQAITHRPVQIERVDFDLLTGRFAVHRFRLAERDGRTPFADFDRLEGRLHLPSLLVGHLWVRDLVLSDSTVRVVRLARDRFNFSDLIQRSGTARRRGDVTVDRFVLRRGTATLEDRALPGWQTWTSERIELEARNVSTRRSDGTAVGSSVTGGAPVSVEVSNLRLYPIHLDARLKVDGADLSIARVYLPPDLPFTLQRGRATTALDITLDASRGLTVDGTGRFEDVAVARHGESDSLAVVPAVTTQVRGFAFHEGRLRLASLALDGAMSVRDPTARRAGRYQLGDVRATVADLTWPATTPGRIDVRSTIPGGGRLTVAGTVEPPPAATQLRLRLAGADLAPWAQFLPINGRVAGIADVDLRMNEPLHAGIPARLEGSVAVHRVAVADARHELLRAARVEASGLEVEWPTRVRVERVAVSAPRGLVERDRDGRFRLTELARASSPASEASAKPSGPKTPDAGTVRVDVGEVAIRDGALAWQDGTRASPARIDVTSIEATVAGLGYPVRGPADVRVRARPPGGGEVRVTGRVALDPPAADLTVRARNAALAPYQAYLPTTARISGATDLDLAVTVPSFAEQRMTARGTAGVSRLDIRDRDRTVLRVERAAAAGITLDWPERLAVEDLALSQPWVLLERDAQGALSLRELLPASPRPGAGTATAADAARAKDNGAPIAVSVGRLRVERGGVRLVDRAVSPPFAVDFQPVRLKADGLSTGSGDPARVELAGQLGPGAELALRGTVGALGGPLRLDVRGELAEFAVPRTNPYLLQYVGWQTTEGRLRSTIQCRIDGDAVSAKTDIRLSRLHLVRAAPGDNAQARIGLPLGVLTTLMKDRRGDIKLSLPVGGRLSDPRFDFKDAIWGAVRTVAVNAITLPVSWIGRVHFTPDSRIERIEIDPVPFAPGTAELTPEGHARVARLVAFFEELPEVRMAVTPVISSRDLEELERGRARAPEKPGAVLAGLAERPSAPDPEVRELAARRLEAVRATLQRAGIDAARLDERKPVRQGDAVPQVALDILEPETPRRSRIREVLDRLGHR